MRDGFASAPRSELYHPVCCGPRQVAPKGFDEPKPIRVVPDPSTVHEKDRVHGAQLLRVIGEFRQMGDDSFLAGMGDRKAVVAKLLRAIEKTRHGVHAKAKGGQIDQAVDISQAAALAFSHVYLRRSGELESRADEPDQDGALCLGHLLISSSVQSSATRHAGETGRCCAFQSSRSANPANRDHVLPPNKRTRNARFSLTC